MGTGKVDADRVVAWLVVIGAHALFWWLLTRDASGDATAEGDGDALQLAWIEPPPPLPPPPIPAVRTPSPPAATPGPDRRPPPDTRADDATPQATTPASRMPLSAVFIEQARRLPAAGDDHADAFRADPLAHRAATLPGVQADTFRMRPPPSIRGALLKIGAMAGGPGYTTDPCPRIADNINALSQGGDSPLLQEELRRKRRLCD